MARLDEDVAVILNELKHLREWTAKRDLIEEEHEERIAALELKNATDAARLGGAVWLAGVVGAVLAYLMSHAGAILKFFLGASMAMALAGCVSEAVGYARWTGSARPVDVLIDSRLDSVCQERIAEQIDKWRAEGADYLAPRVTDQLPRFREAPYATIVVDSAPIADGAANVVGRCYPHTVRRKVAEEAKRMHSAWIRFAPGYCALPMVVGHELGHALGLSDVNDPENVMHWSTDNVDDQVSDEQRDWVR